MQNSILIILGLVAAWLLGGGYNTLIEDYQNGIGVTFKGIKLNWNWTRPLDLKVQVHFQIRNDNVIGVQGLSFDGTLYYGTYNLGKINFPLGFDMPYGVSDHQADVTLNMAYLPTEVTNIFKNRDLSQRFRVAGTLYTDLTNIDINQELILLEYV